MAVCPLSCMCCAVGPDEYRAGLPMAGRWLMTMSLDRQEGAVRHVGVEVPPICHIKSFHPTDDHYGLSPIAARRRRRWTCIMQRLGLVQGAPGQCGAAFGGDCLSRLRWRGRGHCRRISMTGCFPRWRCYHMGARNAGRPMLLEGGLDWKQMGFSPSDMEFQETKRDAAREIATAFGVPPMLLGHSRAMRLMPITRRRTGPSYRLDGVADGGRG